MDTKSCLLLTLCFTLVALSTSQTPTTCDQFSCGSLDAGLCVKKNNTATPSDYILQKCGSAQTCPFDVKDTVSCQATQTPKLWPGSSCKSNEDCINNQCESNFCVGKKQNEECTSPSDCVIGLTCIKGDSSSTCQQQADKDATCTQDTDCKNSYGCFNGNCTDYFSQDDGVAVTNPYICKSGYSYQDKCATLTNVASVDSECSEDCKYLDAQNTTVTVTGSCQCGYNKAGKKHCILGSGEKQYKDFVGAAKIMLNDTTLCHTAERNFVCAEKEKEDTSYAFRSTLKMLTNNQILAQDYQKLVNADSCVYDVVYPAYDESPVKPDKFQCAKFTCDSKGKSCLTSTNPFSEKGDGISVVLTKGICNTTQSCSVGPEPVDQAIYDETFLNGTCVSHLFNPPTVLRYPGESCTKPDDCFNDAQHAGTCTNNKCTGKNETETCTRTAECVVGLYCDGKTCVKQLDENKDCTETWQCKNNLACYNKKCVPLASIKVGGDMTDAAIGSFSTNPDKRYLCEFGELTQDDKGSKCAKYSYNKPATVPDADGFVTCNWGDECPYTDGTNNFTQPCTCGYNADGQGYCPLSHDYNVKDWNNRQLTVVKKFDNQCHSLNRFTCNIASSQSLLAEIQDYVPITVDAHKYYKAVDCAYSVLSGSYINLSFALLAIIAFIF